MPPPAPPPPPSGEELASKELAAPKSPVSANPFSIGSVFFLPPPNQDMISLSYEKREMLYVMILKSGLLSNNPSR